ncbi:diguanylate cyclase domain-containing protein [Solicola sp. PLA-1-18]|uniref:diguanylate cyclase domain-containing protein n=1 Tax=Solicola sp. PLA-1-18 TaxID=3380532 RepID=UPI003B7B7B26
MDERAVYHALAHLIGRATEPLTARVAARALSDAAGDLFVVVAGVGVALVEDGRARHVHATTELAGRLGSVQDDHGRGPVHEAVRSTADVTALGSAQLRPWPEFARVAEDAGVGGVAALPLVGRGRCWGVLSLYLTRPDALTPDVLEVARLLADVATTHQMMAFEAAEVRAATHDLAHVSTHDPVTDVSNRTGLSARLDAALAAGRRLGRATGVLFIDVDDFEALRRTKGDRVADDVLREAARRIRAELRRADTVARLGDDEFVVVCSDLAVDADPDRILSAVADRVREAIARPMATGAGEVTLTVSIGRAVSDDTTGGADLVDAADRAMYRDRAA